MTHHSVALPFRRRYLSTRTVKIVQFHHQEEKSSLSKEHNKIFPSSGHTRDKRCKMQNWLIDWLIDFIRRKCSLLINNKSQSSQVVWNQEVLEHTTLISIEIQGISINQSREEVWVPNCCYHKSSYICSRHGFFFALVSCDDSIHENITGFPMATLNDSKLNWEISIPATQIPQSINLIGGSTGW